MPEDVGAELSLLKADVEDRRITRTEMLMRFSVSGDASRSEGGCVTDMAAAICTSDSHFYELYSFASDRDSAV